MSENSLTFEYHKLRRTRVTFLSADCFPCQLAVRPLPLPPPPPSPAPHTWDYNSKMSLLAGKVYTLAVVSSYALCLVSSVTSNVIVVIRYFALLLQSRYRAVGALKRNLAVMITFWPLGIDVKRP